MKLKIRCYGDILPIILLWKNEIFLNKWSLTMAEFLAKCPHCSSDLQMQDKWVNLEVECPICKNKFICVTICSNGKIESTKENFSIRNRISTYKKKKVVLATIISVVILSIVIAVLMPGSKDSVDLTGAVCANIENITKETFKKHKKLEQIIIHQGVYSISNNAFDDCENLKNIKIITSDFSLVRKIPQKILVELIIPNHVRKIPVRALSGCKNLKSVTIPDSVKIIEEAAFSLCSALSEVTLPAGVESIEESAFFYCSNLKKINIPDSVVTIGAHALASTGLLQISIPKHLRDINANTFSNCKNLKKVVVPRNVKRILNLAFEKCTALTEVIIENDDPRMFISDDAFDGCDNAFVWKMCSNGKERILWCYPKTSKDAHYTIPRDVATIWDYAFADCVNLKQVNIPDNVSSIGSFAFKGCTSLTTVNIGNGVKRIFGWAFDGCSNVTDVTFGKGVREIRDYAFYDCKKLKKISIPENCKYKYDCSFRMGCNVTGGRLIKEW